MKKAVIIGCPGAGKSTFARNLHNITGLTLYHLDLLNWNPDRTTVPKEVFLERLDCILGREDWIIDGNYGSTMEMRIRECDTVFFFDIPTEVCLEGVRARIGKQRPDMPWVEEIEDDEFIGFIKNFREHSYPKIIDILNKYPDKTILWFKSHKDSDGFLSRLDVRKELFRMKDEKYKKFSAKLIPTIAPETIIGIRIPTLRTYAKQILRDGRAEAFLSEPEHEYFEENNLHAFLIEQIKDFDVCIRELERFLPHVDNWATCDSLRPKCFAKNKKSLLPRIFDWLQSEHEYTVRFGIECLMLYYLDVDFKPEYLERVAGIAREEYYIKMMVAWYFATALAKQYDAALSYITSHRLSPWVHAKTIQKARESYRLTETQKEYLKYL